jgi:hydrogenase maturation protease
MSVLVAGVGNVLLGDDGFGVEVVRRLAAVEMPEDVRVADFGIRGMHLAYELLDGHDLVVLIDAMSRGGAPGTIYVLEANVDNLPPAVADGHSLDPASVLAMVKLLGGTAGRTIVVGCEPAALDEGIGLSDPVAQAVDEAIRVVLKTIDREKEAMS